MIRPFLGLEYDAQLFPLIPNAMQIIMFVFQPSFLVTSKHVFRELVSAIRLHVPGAVHKAGPFSIDDMSAFSSTGFWIVGDFTLINCARNFDIGSFSAKAIYDSRGR